MRSFFIGCVCTCLTASGVLASDGAALKWNKNYGNAKQIAQAAKRPMLLVLENPAEKEQRIDETKLTPTERTILTKDNFELCRVDVNTDYGKRVAQAFGAKVFPYTVVTDDASKHIVYRKPGPMTPKDWTVALAKDQRTKVVVTEAASSSVRYQPSFHVNSGVIIQQAIPMRSTCPNCRRY